MRRSVDTMARNALERSLDFYFGQGRRETVRRFLRSRSDDPFTLGFCLKNEWFVFADRVAKETYLEMSVLPKLNAVFGALTGALKKVKGAEVESAADFQHVLTNEAKKVDLKKLLVDEEQLRERLVRELNWCVMHEVTLHRAGRLRHVRFAALVKFSGRGVAKDSVYGALGRTGPRAMASMARGGKVTRLIFEEHEKQAAKIEKLLVKLKALDPALTVSYARKEYPVEFTLDDVNIG